MERVTSVKCYIMNKIIIIETIKDHDENRKTKIEIPAKDIDLTIVRERAKIHNIKTRLKDISDEKID